MGAVCHGDGLYPVLGWLVRQVLLCTKAPSKPNHGFIYCNITRWVVACLEVGDEEIEKSLDFVDSCRWNSCIVMAHVEQPKELLKAISSKDPRKERDLACPGGTPVSLDVGDLDDSHIQNDSKETLHLRGCHRNPAGIARARA